MNRGGKGKNKMYKAVVLTEENVARLCNQDGVARIFNKEHR